MYAYVCIMYVCLCIFINKKSLGNWFWDNPTSYPDPLRLASVLDLKNTGLRKLRLRVSVCVSVLVWWSSECRQWLGIILTSYFFFFLWVSVCHFQYQLFFCFLSALIYVFLCQTIYHSFCPCLWLICLPLCPSLTLSGRRNYFWSFLYTSSFLHLSTCFPRPVCVTYLCLLTIVTE